MANDVSNIRIEPVDLNWGNPETTSVIVTVGGGDGTSFHIDATDGTKFYVWGDSGASADPAPAGRTGITFSTAGGTTPLDAAAAVTAIAANANFNCKIDPDNSSKFIIQNVGIGTAIASVDVDSTYTLAQVRLGSDFPLGFIDGDVEFNPTEDLFEVTAEQTGTQIIDKIRTGNNVEPVVVAMKESVAAKLKIMLEAGGVSVTPGGGTEVTGWGETKRFTNISNETRQLIFHPIRNAAAVLTDDLAVWRAYPNITGLNFSGESDRLINVEFEVIPDPILLTTLNLFVFGNHEQNLLK